MTEQVCGTLGVLQLNSTALQNKLDGGCNRYLGSIHISDTGTADLQYMGSLRHIDGALTMFRNERLTSLAGLESLRNIGGELLIHNHDVLADVGALGQVRSVGGDLTIRGNQELRQDDLEQLFEGVMVGGEVILEGGDAP